MLFPRQTVLFVFQVFYYSAGVFETSGVPPDVIQYAVLGTGAINVLMTAISVRYVAALFSCTCTLLLITCTEENFIST